MMGLTEQQAACLAFIRRYIAENGASPSYDEIKDALGLAAKSRVHYLITGLEQRGHVVKLERCASSVWPTDALRPEIPSLDSLDAAQLSEVIARASGLLADMAGCAHAAEVGHRVATAIGALPTGGVQ